MIYVTKDTRNIKVRREGDTRLDEYTLSLVNNLTQTSYSIKVKDSGLSGYYVFKTSWPEDMIDGEYTYTVVGGKKTIVTGVMWFGDMIDADVVYDTTINDIVYDPDKGSDPGLNNAFLLDDGSALIMDNGLILGF